MTINGFCELAAVVAKHDPSTLARVGAELDRRDRERRQGRENFSKSIDRRHDERRVKRTLTA